MIFWSDPAGTGQASQIRGKKVGTLYNAVYNASLFRFVMPKENCSNAICFGKHTKEANNVRIQVSCKN